MRNTAEEVEMAQPKKAKPGPGKKTGAAKPSGSAVTQKSGGSNNAFFILIIIILITVIVLLVNRYADKGMFKFGMPGKKQADQSGKDQEKKSKNPDEKKGTGEIRQDKNSAADIAQDVKDKTPSEKEVTLYFLKLDEKTEKIYLAQVKRKIRTDKPLESAIESLIKGPTRDEENRGFITAVPVSLKVRGIAMKGKTAVIDFSGTIEEGAAGDILIKRIQQIVYTATQFDNVESIVILVNGKGRKTLGSDGLSIGYPLRR